MRRLTVKMVGFTIVELLVVIAVIGVLVALLLPAVQQARGAARRAQCLSNLRQLGLAVNGYESFHGCLPPGNITIGPCCLTPSYTTWTIAILPFLEQSVLSDRYNQSLFNQDPANTSVCRSFVSTFICPADVNTDKLVTPETGPVPGLLYAPGSYRIVSGTSDGSELWWDDGTALLLPSPPNGRGPMHNVGNPIHPMTCEKYRAITDGLSKTLMIGEYHTTTYNTRRTLWAYAYTSYNSSAVMPLIATLIPDYLKCWESGGGNTCKRAFGSLHSGSEINFLFCDGSARTISTTMNLKLLFAAATIAGNDASEF